MRSTTGSIGWAVAGLLLILAAPAGAQPSQGSADGSDSAQRAAGEETPIDPQAEEAFYVGNGLLADGDPAGALAAYDQALAIDARLHRVHLYRARAFLLLNDHKRAREAADVFAKHAHSEQDKQAFAEIQGQIAELEGESVGQQKDAVVATGANRRLEVRVQADDAMPGGEQAPAQSTSGPALPPPPKALGPTFLVAGGVSTAIGIALQIAGLSLAWDFETSAAGAPIYHTGGGLVAVGIILMSAGVPLTVAARVPPPPALVLAVEPGSRAGSVFLCGRW